MGTSTTVARRPKRQAEPVKSAVWGNALPSLQQAAEIKRQSIIRQAARSFNRGGFYGTSMVEIAARLGVTKAALYRYVQDKHDILFACFNLGLDSSFAHLDRAEREGKDGLDKLQIALRGYLTDMIGDLGHPSALLEENALRPEQARAVIRRRDMAEKRFRAIVSEGIDDGSILPCNPKLAVFAMLGPIQWVPKWYRDGGEWSAEEVAESLVEMCTRGIAAHPAPLRADVHRRP
jgi:TetR/AcrR family transcriptional regulator